MQRFLIITDASTENCAYTFIVPNSGAQPSVCVDTKQTNEINQVTEIHADGEYLCVMYKTNKLKIIKIVVSVLSAKLRVEEIRNEISEEKRQLANSKIILKMQEKVSKTRYQYKCLN